VAIFSNVSMVKTQLSCIAKMAIAGIARAIVPAFTPYDGDIVFAIFLASNAVRKWCSVVWQQKWCEGQLLMRCCKLSKGTALLLCLINPCQLSLG